MVAYACFNQSFLPFVAAVTARRDHLHELLEAASVAEWTRH